MHQLLFQLCQHNPVWYQIEILPWDYFHNYNPHHSQSSSSESSVTEFEFEIKLGVGIVETAPEAFSNV